MASVWPRATFVLMTVTLIGAGACQDPQEYFRHGEADAGLIPVTTGAAGGGAAGASSGGAGTTSATGAAGTLGGAGSIGSSGGAGTFGGAGSIGSSGAGTTGTGNAGTVGSAGSSGAAGTVGHAGTTGTTGAAGTTAPPCPGCMVEVVYTCLTGASDSAGFVLEAKNTGTTLFLLKDLTLRYWFTVDPGKEQELDCDTARLTCAYIGTSMMPIAGQSLFVPVTPPRTKANEYVQIAFTQGAIDVGGTTGAIQLRLHNKDFTPMDQTDDYSADCGSTGQAHDSSRVTAYIKGALVGGTEPQ
jgi:hypothetical protein